MIAFKTYTDCPPNLKPAGVPEEWPWLVVEIPDHEETSYLAQGFTVLPLAEFNAYKAQRYDLYIAWLNAYDLDRQNLNLRVRELLSDNFSHLDAPKIDFRRHLKPDVYLQKQVFMGPNGRPTHAAYSYEGVLIAEIAFDFEVDAFNFVTRRIERLSYYRKNGTKEGPWVIADDFYLQESNYDLAVKMQERTQARAFIIEQVKVFLNYVMAQYYLPQGLTYPQILALAGDFWIIYDAKISAWINVGSRHFIEDLNADTTFPFLNLAVDAEGTTVKQYIESSLTY